MTLAGHVLFSLMGGAPSLKYTLQDTCQAAGLPPLCSKFVLFFPYRRQGEG